jgi:nitrite reductase/ring-hydroxylating ferredoxin subunit
MATTLAFRTLDDAGKLPDNYVNPYYLEDLKRRVSVARAGGKLYAFDDLCKHEGPRRAPAELRLNARKKDVIPLYTY